jgi:hypothetical protein
MEHLSKHIAESVRKAGNRHQSEFPKDPDIEATVGFLEYNGFEKYDGPLTVTRYSNYHGKDSYEIGFHGKMLSIYKQKDNVVFCIWLGGKTDKDRYYANFGDFASNPGGPSNINQVFYKTYDEFRDAVMDHYGW